MEDLLGLAPYGKAINTTVKKSFQGIEGFLRSVCLPAFDEIGLMFRDKVRYWRLLNILKIIEKSKGKLDLEGSEIKIKAHPRVALAIIENGSVIDDDEVQELWAGLFASSCTKEGQNDENLIFVDLLKQLTSVEARILKYSCETAYKIIHPNGLVVSEDLEIKYEDLVKITKIDDVHRLDRELDHLRSLELITGGFYAGDKNLNADITPTALALNLYVRCQGFSKSIAEYWKDSLYTPEQLDKVFQESQRKLSENKSS